MPYIVSSTSMTLAPVSQTWEYVALGDNFDGTKAYSRKKDVLLEFDSCNLTQYSQWANKAGGSVASIDMLSPSGTNFVQYGPVVLSLESRPKVQNVNVIGSWTIRVSQVLSNA